jgi:nitrite reductase/ring-hydroxylating ferredoxin subunit
MTNSNPATRVLRFPAHQANCLWADGVRYFALQSGEATPIMAKAKCPHRGGPLHLGTVSADGLQIHCPMHQLATRVATLRRSALPMILRQDEVVVMVPQGEGDLVPFQSSNGRDLRSP